MHTKGLIVVFLITATLGGASWLLATADQNPKTRKLPVASPGQSPPRPAEPRWPEPGSPLRAPTVSFPADFGIHKIYLDAGHGSQGNTGAISCFCEAEQEFTLRATGHLARKLKGLGHFKTLVSRQAGQLVPYRQRLKDAYAFGAELILSIHSDVRGEFQLWSPSPGKTCRKNLNDPGFAVLWSDIGPDKLVSQRQRLAQALAGKMISAGFLPYDGNDYLGLYQGDDQNPGVFVALPAQARQVMFLLRPRIPSVVIETHHSLDPREEQRFQQEETLEVLANAIAAALADFDK